MKFFSLAAIAILAVAANAVSLDTVAQLSHDYAQVGAQPSHDYAQVSAENELATSCSPYYPAACNF